MEIVEQKMCEACSKHCPPQDTRTAEEKAQAARDSYKKLYGSDPGANYGLMASNNYSGGIVSFPYCCGAQVMTALYDKKTIETRNFQVFTVAISTPEQNVDESLRKAGFKVLATFKRAHGGREPSTLWGIKMNEEKPQAVEVPKLVAEVKEIVKAKVPKRKTPLKRKSKFSLHF